MGDTLGAWYTPLALGTAIVAWMLSGEVQRFLAVLVVATPCPLLIAIPVAVIGAISLAARRGIIIKNPGVLEQIDSCRTFIFDKTGTLTYGKPTLTGIVCAPGFKEADVLAAAASLERYSKHPLANAILELARQRASALSEVSRVSERPGEGLRGTTNGREVWITGRNKVSAEGLQLPPVEVGLECLVFLDGVFTGLFRFEDSPRGDSRVLLVRFSELVVEKPRIREIDINPLLASPEQLLALDARMVLFGPEVKQDALPRPAIRPYPAQYISRWTMKDGREVVIRPIRPEDEPLMVEFHGTLSESTVYLRYFHMQKLDSRVAHDRLIRKCFIDYDREMALVADRTDPQTGRHELLGVGRLTRRRSPAEAELGVLVTDRCQRAGLGTELVRRLMMLKLATRFHFTVTRDDDPVSLIAILDLDGRVSIA